MADLLETSTFPVGVTRIETNEPVVGGEDGVANRGLKLLASRTRWLKDQFDALATSLGTLYALRTGDYSTLRARATTKADVGLALVANYAPTNDASGGSTTQVATAAAVKTAVQGVVTPPTNLGIGGSGDSRTVTSSTGMAATLPLATNAAAGLMRTADKVKLDGIATGANVWPDVYVGSSKDNTSFPVGETLLVTDVFANRNGTVAVRMHPTEAEMYSVAGSGALLSGMWAQRGGLSGAAAGPTLVTRIA